MIRQELAYHWNWLNTMRRFDGLLWWATILGGRVLPLDPQTATLGDAAKRALIISNTGYLKLSRAPVDDSGTKDLEEVLRDAQFVVSVKHDLDLKSLTQVLDEFQSSVHRGDIGFIYYSGYAMQVGESNYLVPVDFDPTSNAEPDYSAYRSEERRV